MLGFLELMVKFDKKSRELASKFGYQMPGKSFDMNDMKLRIVDTWTTDHIGKWGCRIGRTFLQEKLVGEHCIADLGTLGLSPEAVAPIRMFAEDYMGKVARIWPSLSVELSPTSKGMSLREIDFENGKEVQRRVMVSITREAIPVSFFQIPDGYHEMVNPMQGLPPGMGNPLQGLPPGMGNLPEDLPPDTIE